MNEGFVYAGTLEKGALGELIVGLFSGEESFFIKEEVDDYNPYNRLPEQREVPQKGRIFSKGGEIRWEKDEGEFDILILTEHKIEDLPEDITAVEDKWEVERNKKLYLAPLTLGQISPKFERYPKDAKILSAVFFKKTGVNVFVSPRGFEK